VDVADQLPDLVQKMAAAYQNYSKQVGVVAPTGEIFARQIAAFAPGLNQTQTVNVDQIKPEVALEKAKQIREIIPLGA
jgi:hypothetical protein